jgi:iron complex outermembrane recepter protein
MNRLFSLLLILLMTSAVCAGDEVSLEEIVVTAKRYEEKLPGVPAHVTVITEEDIKNSPSQNIPDLLKTEAGIHVYDIGGNRRNIAVDLRGFGETASLNTLVLVDGRRINQADLSGVDWFQLPIERVKKIEIIRGGTGSVLYGDNAAGGIINIITKEGEAFNGGAEISGGSYGTFKSSAYAGGALNNFSAHLSAGYLKSDGYRDNGDTDAKDFGINANSAFNDFIKLNFSFGFHKDRTGLPGALKESDFEAGIARTGSTHPRDFIDVEDYYFQLSPQVSFSGDSLFQVDTSCRKRSFFSFASGDWGNFTGDSLISTVMVSPRVILKTDMGKLKNSLVLGFDYQKSDNDITNDSVFFGLRNTGKFDLGKENSGCYFHNEITAAEILKVSAGYRHDRAEFRFDPGYPERADMKKDAYTAGINYAFYEKSYVYLGFSRSFRYPLIDELYSFFTNTVNINLRAQTSDNYEMGIRYYFSDNIYTHINFFRIDTDDEIFFNPLSFQNENLDGATRRNGAEISLGARISEWLMLKGAYAYTDAEIRGGVFEGKSFPNVPMHAASFEAISSPGKGFTFVLNGVYIGKRPFVSDFPNAFDDQKNYVVLNGKLYYKWKSITAFLDIYNLTNKRYSEYGSVSSFPAEKAFYPSPKRNFLAGLKVDL